MLMVQGHSALLLGVLRRLTLVFCLSLGLIGCTPSPPVQDFAYAAEAFTVTVQGRVISPSEGDTPTSSSTARSLSATVSVGAPDAEGHRAVTVIFLEPQSLAGLTASAVLPDPGATASHEAIAVTVTRSTPYGTLQFSDAQGGFLGLLQYAQALLPVGDVVERAPLDGEGNRTVIRATADGSVQATYTFPKGSRLPTRIVHTTADRRLELDITPKAAGSPSP